MEDYTSFLSRMSVPSFWSYPLLSTLHTKFCPSHTFPVSILICTHSLSAPTPNSCLKDITQILLVLRISPCHVWRAICNLTVPGLRPQTHRSASSDNTLSGTFSARAALVFHSCNTRSFLPPQAAVTSATEIPSLLSSSTSSPLYFHISVQTPLPQTTDFLLISPVLST